MVEPQGTPPRQELIVPGKSLETKEAVPVEVINEDQLSTEVKAPPSPPQTLPPASPEKSFFQSVLDAIPWGYLILIPIFGIFFPLFNATLERAAEAYKFPYQIDREEGFLLQQAVMMAEGESIYQPIETEPYLVGNYPPVYPALVKGMLGTDELTMRPARLVIMLALVLLCVVVALYLYEETRSFFPGLLALFLFLSYYGTREWIAFGRVDIPALAFAVCGMAACSNKHRIVGVTLGTLMLCLAFFTKQTQIIAPAAIFLGLWWQGERKLAVGFAGALGILCGALLYYGTLITQGEFWLHLVDYNRNAMNWNAFLGFLLNTELDFAWGAYVLLILGWGIAYLLRKIRGKIPREIDPAKHRPRSRALPILVWYSILSLLFTVTSAKVGSAVNYYLEFHLAVSLLVALVLGLLMKELPHREKMWHRSAIWTANISLIVALGAYGISQYLPREKLGGAAIRQIVFTPIPQRTSHFDYVYAQVAQASDPVLSDDPTFQVFSGQRAIFQPFIMSQLAAERQWSPELLINRIYQREFELIILTQPIRRVNDPNALIPEYAPVQGWAPQIIAAIASSYKFHEQAGRFYLYIRPNEERFQRGLQSAGNSSQVRERPTS